MQSPASHARARTERVEAITLPSKVPLCVHPTSLIQLLQFWVPRTKEFEEAILGSLRLPFLFQELDVEAERMSLRILKGLGLFEGSNEISEQTITQVILNEDLRSRLQSEHSKEEDIELIRGALIAEMQSQADSEAAKAKELETALKIRDESLAELSAEAKAKDRELRELRSFREATEENRRRGRALAIYLHFSRPLFLYRSSRRGESNDCCHLSGTLSVFYLLYF